MNKRAAVFGLLIAVALVRPVPAPAAERGFTGAESSCGINGGWYDERFDWFAGDHRIPLRTATDGRGGGAVARSPDLPELFGAGTGILRHCPAGLRTLVYDLDTTPAVDGPDRGSADDIRRHRPDALLAPSRDVYLHSMLEGRQFLNHDGKGEEEWFRLSPAGDVPEPDGWIMLIAGLLGVCAVARRRIIQI